MFDFAVYHEYACYTSINVQLKYPFFVGGINDSDIDLLSSRGEATVLKEAIIQQFPRKCFERLCARVTCAPWSSGSAPWQPHLTLQCSINNNDFEEETVPVQYM